ncbi:homocysteine S-methyltransferase [Streptomyces sp. P38-E01]|uniref:Homocysteine S-methyltransferase n=1 Tax=Streptomyces tardus TaxID=2780544 RepID=A0A949JQF4_9ACTN|nr:homocysteine S-methyltransferase [Streptomyces tardus]MBU7600399.1 homocysteine S-methyltransferase [Streptomyces tardus]
MTPPPPLAQALAAGTPVLDGGLADRLADQGCDLSGELWSARLLADDPQSVYEAHLAYVRAGARVLITGSYQASAQGFARAGVASAEVDELFARSVRLARAAGRQTREPVWVAASVGPYGAVCADGGEYRGRYGLSVRELTRFHRPRIEALAAAGPDVLALETVPDVVEAEAMLAAAQGCGVPLWLSYTVEGGLTRAGQPLADAFALAAGNAQLIAVGVNCCAPREVSEAVELAASTTRKPVVVYPNSGESFEHGRWQGPAAFDPVAALGWRAAGARLIGGCCRVGPDRIAALARTLAGEQPPVSGGESGSAR